MELRVAVSLSWLWQRQGQRTEARQLLAEIYGWFTDGFDTVSLQEEGAARGVVMIWPCTGYPAYRAA
jgi:hypothetical protein